MKPTDLLKALRSQPLEIIVGYPCRRLAVWEVASPEGVDLDPDDTVDSDKGVFVHPLTITLNYGWINTPKGKEADEEEAMVHFGQYGHSPCLDSIRDEDFCAQAADVYLTRKQALKHAFTVLEEVTPEDWADPYGAWSPLKGK